MTRILHPVRGARIVRRRLASHFGAARIAAYGRRHFAGDPRYRLEHVIQGFQQRLSESPEDSGLLERICEAYQKALRDSPSAPAWEATEWWKQVRRDSLKSIMGALECGNMAALAVAYRNFFRDRCSSGLVPVPVGASQGNLETGISNTCRSAWLTDALYRLDYWATRTDSRFPVSDLATPEIGNPFGLKLNGLLIRVDAEYQHYCSRLILDRVDADRPVIAEIGGGYGGVAYFLLRDKPKLTYMGFDVPESIALASWYLLKAFPERRFLLYGEMKLTEETMADFDVILLPVSELSKAPARSVDCTFSSNALSDLSAEAVKDYLAAIVRVTRSWLIYVGERRGANTISTTHGNSDIRASDWNCLKYPKADQVEAAYRLFGG